MRQQFCSAKCRKGAWQRKRDDRETEILDLTRRLALKVGLKAEDLR